MVSTRLLRVVASGYPASLSGSAQSVLGQPQAQELAELSQRLQEVEVVSGHEQFPEHGDVHLRSGSGGRPSGKGARLLFGVVDRVVVGGGRACAE